MSAVEGSIVRERSWNWMLVLAAALSGCQQEEPVSSYTVSYPDRLELRLLAAIIPDGDQSWFVDLLGPAQTVSGQKAALDGFVDSLRFDKKDTPMSWKSPEGWKEQPGREMRLA